MRRLLNTVTGAVPLRAVAVTASMVVYIAVLLLVLVLVGVLR